MVGLIDNEMLRRLLLALGLLSHWLLLDGQLASASLMSLPDGIENVLGFVPVSSFQCQADGYFGDIDNDCRLFHLCQRQVGAGGRVEWRHWTYACGNQTMFNQLTLTCAFVDEAIPCRHASQFQYLNEVIHRPAEPFLTDADVTSGLSYYSNRVMSDGARARAFHDSQLLAQLGGNQGQARPSASFESPAASNSLNSIDETPANQQPVERPARQFQSQVQAPRFQQERNFEPLGPAHPSVAGAAPAQQNSHSLIEEHSFQLHHQQLQRQAGAAAAANSQQLEALQSHAAPPPELLASTENLPARRAEASAGPPRPQDAQVDVASSSSRQQTFARAPSNQAQQQEAPAQIDANAARQSFEFSIATNHQAGPTGEPASVLFFGQPQAQSQGQLQFPNADELRRQFASQAPPSAQWVAPATTESTSTSSTTLTPTAGAANVPASTPAATREAQTTSAPVEFVASTVGGAPASSTLTPTFTSSQRLAQLALPQQATSTLAPQPTAALQATQATQATTSTSTPTITTSPLTGASAPTVDSRAARRASQQQQQVASGRRGSRPERARPAGFQSTRLSSAQKRQTDSSPIVMRRQIASEAAAAAAVSPAASRSGSALVSLDEHQDHLGGAASESGAWSTAGDFWRRSFDAQLMAPKFESLLLRRRV